jgi:hypothetical protein
MIILWGNNSWAVWTNVLLAGAALVYGTYEWLRFNTFWGLGAAAAFLILGGTSEWARRKSTRTEQHLSGDWQRMSEERRCPDCGQLNDPRWNFCSNCGTPRGGKL